MIDNPDACDHDTQTYLRTDTENAPDTVYVEWRCCDCRATISEVYHPTGHVIVHPPDGEPYQAERGVEP